MTTVSVVILLENTAGQKNSSGSDFKQWAEILSKLKPKDRFGVCFDTCHAFVAGYQFDTPTTYHQMWKDFDATINILRSISMCFNVCCNSRGSTLAMK